MPLELPSRDCSRQRPNVSLLHWVLRMTQGLEQGGQHHSASAQAVAENSDDVNHPNSSRQANCQHSNATRPRNAKTPTPELNNPRGTIIVNYRS